MVEKILSLADIKINGDRPWDIIVHNDEFYNRVLKDGSLGLGESYMANWWDSAALDETMFRMMRSNLEQNLKLTWSMRWNIFKIKFFTKQDKLSSLKVIKQHYQLEHTDRRRWVDRHDRR